MAMIIVKVRLAKTTLGWRKMGTALLTASTPVSAVQPLANARNKSHVAAVVVIAAGVLVLLRRRGG